MAESSSGGSGLGLIGRLAPVFIVLKLTHVVAWSWLWVTAPIWIGWSLLLAFIGFCLLMHHFTRSK